MRTPYFNGGVRNRVFRQEAMSWIGTPFRHLCHTKQTGVDCVGFPLIVFRVAGLIPFEYYLPHYPLDGGYHGAVSALDAELVRLGCFDRIWQRDCFACPVVLPTVLEGDLFTMQLGRWPYHCALSIGGLSFLHAHPTSGVIQSDLRDATYLKRIRAVWRPVV